MKKEIKKFNWWIVPTVLCGIAFVASAGFYLGSRNLSLLLIVLPSIAGAGFCIFRMSGHGSLRFQGISELGPVLGDINTFCIYGKMENGVPLADRVEFENVPQGKLQGDRWYFEDLNKWLYVTFNDLKDEGRMKAFELPDSSYTDPARLSIQLNMGRVNELFQLEPSLFDQLKPWIMLAAITIVGFLIFLSGSG